MIVVELKNGDVHQVLTSAENKGFVLNMLQVMDGGEIRLNKEPEKFKLDKISEKK